MFGTAFIDDTFPIVIQASQFSTGAALDPTGSPAYRVYEHMTATPILTGSLSVFDDANTTGYYAAAITLSAANGFEVGKFYHIRVSATVDSVAAAEKIAMFRVNANPLTAAEIGSAPEIAFGVWSYVGGRTLSSFGTLVADTAAAVWASASRTLTSYGSLAVDFLNTAVPAPSSGRDNLTVGRILGFLIRFFINRNAIQSSVQTLYADDGTTALLTGTLTSTDTTETRGAMDD